MKITTGYKSCCGNTREINQDAMLLRRTEQEGDSFIVLAVCDGVGGLEHGEVASALAVKTLNDWYDSVLEWLDMKTAEGEILYAHLKDAVEACNQNVCEYRILHQIDTGTTLSLLMLFRDVYSIIQVGDSRIYRYRNGGLEQLTKDASVTRLKNGRMKSYLDNYIGKQEELWFTTATGKLEKGDIFVCCSDGLYHYLLPEDISRIEKEAKKAKKIDAACEKLIQWMLERGERDNISVGLLAAE